MKYMSYIGFGGLVVMGIIMAGGAVMNTGVFANNPQLGYEIIGGIVCALLFIVFWMINSECDND